MRNNFDHELEVLNNELIEMGSMIETAITQAVEALVKKDKELAKQAIVYDSEIDAKEKAIESHCLSLLLQQQPVASDLRMVTAAIKMITDMERIGDHASDISEFTLVIYDQDYEAFLGRIPDIAKATINMVIKSVDAFVARNVTMAKEVQEYDDVVDDLFDIIKNDLTEQIRSNQGDSTHAIDLIMIAKYFERIGDHAVNIAEWVEFSQTGMYKGSRMM